MENKEPPPYYNSHYEYHDTHNDGKPFDPKVFFSDYHYFEEYCEWEALNPDLSNHCLIETDYGRGRRRYRMVRRHIRIYERGRCREQNWIIAIEKLSQEELKQLKPWCTCPMCRGEFEWYQVMGACEGCLAMDVAVDQIFIDRAREYRERLGGKRLPTLPRYYLYVAIKWGFVLLFIAMFILMMYFSPKQNKRY